MKILRVLLEGIYVVGLCILAIGAVASFIAVFMLSAQHLGPWIPSGCLVFLYIFAVATAIMRERRAVNKHEEVPSVGDNDPKPSGGGSVVKLNDETVATAILESRRRAWDGNPVVKDPPTT